MLTNKNWKNSLTFEYKCRQTFFVVHFSESASKTGRGTCINNDKTNK